MNLLTIMANLIKECNYDILVNKQRNHITFKPKNNAIGNDAEGHASSVAIGWGLSLLHYRLTIQKTNAWISKVKLVSKSRKGNVYFIPDKILLSVDLHNPQSLKIIRNWLKTL